MQTPPCILVVDDQSMNVHILSTRLTLEGYDVLTATDGDQAIAMARDRQPDLILLDVIMPEPDGFEVCRRLKADSSLPFIPILMVTAKGEPQDMVAGFEAGADDYLTKPLDRRVLVARVAALLRGKARHDAAHDQTMQLEQQSAQLEAWGRALEDQLIDLERMSLLKRFLSPEAVQAAIALGDGGGWRAGRKEVAVLSCVLHGFEAFAQRTEPAEVFEMLRDYHQVIAPFMNGCGGILAQFASHDIQFMFDAPSGHNPVEQAVRMAVAMHESLASQGEKWRSRRNGLDVGIGVAHGEVTLGLMGLENRLDYAVIGAVRRLASRLGEEARGASVLISQPVWEAVEKRFHAEPAGQLVLQGYAEPIPFFEVTGEAENPL
ncbi:MAG: response regulator [Candidatus Tectomicrobia bacterium]|nr:response regulator [Candidatus Tectomicrobia bacterium]